MLLADGESLFGMVRAGEAPGSLVLEPGGHGRGRGGETPRALRLEELIGIDFGRRPAPETVTVVLTTGERLAGKISFPAPGRVAVARADGTVQVPLALCASLRLTAPPPPAGPKDTLLLANGDQITGKLLEIREGKARVQAWVGVLPVDLKRVAAIRFADAGRQISDASRDGSVPPLPSVTLELTSGERIAGEWEGLEARGQREHSDEEGVIRVRSAWGGRLAIPLPSVSRLLVRNGKSVFLSDLRPVEARHTPYLDVARPYRINESQSGRPLQLGGVRFGRGLGVHARSDLTYELAGGYKAFAAIIGIDAAVGNAGSVVFRVLGDDRVLYESPVVRGGEEPRSIRVDVSGVLLLRLVVDFADNGDIGDHADWANARLLR